MKNAKKTLKQLRRLETFLSKELHRFERFETREPEAKLADNPLLRGFRQGVSDRQAETHAELREVTQAIAALKSARRSDDHDKPPHEDAPSGAPDDAPHA